MEVLDKDHQQYVLRTAYLSCHIRLGEERLHGLESSFSLFLDLRAFSHFSKVYRHSLPYCGYEILSQISRSDTRALNGNSLSNFRQLFYWLAEAQWQTMAVLPDFST